MLVMCLLFIYLVYIEKKFLSQSCNKCFTIFLPNYFYFFKENNSSNQITLSTNAETITKLITVVYSECQVVNNHSNLLSSPLVIQVELIEQFMIMEWFLLIHTYIVAKEYF